MMVVKDLNKILSKCCQDVNMPADCNVLCQYDNKDDNSNADYSTYIKWQLARVEELNAAGKECATENGHRPTTMAFDSCWSGK